MRQILNFIFVVSTCVFVSTTGLAKAKTKNPAASNPGKSAKLDIQVGEEKNPFDSLKIKFVRFDHEHSSTGPGQPFSATTGVYFLKITDATSSTEVSVYTNTEGKSNPAQYLEHYEIQILKDTDNQKTITLQVKKLN